MKNGKTMIQWIKKNYKVYFFIGYTFLLLIHFVLKDSIFPLSVVFYAFPLLILIGLGFFLTLLFFRRKKYCITLLIITSATCFYWVQNYYYSTKTKITEDTSKILFWNVAKKHRLPLQNISHHVQQHQPEILAFVEVIRETTSNLDSLKKELPNYNFKVLKGAMLVGTRNEVEILDFSYKTDAYKINLLELQTNNSRFKFIITDLTAYLHVDKKEILNVLLNYANKNNVDAIVGDFNAPFESIHFKDFNINYQSFRRFNDGFTATWPLGIPLFELDHIWISKKHQPVRLYKKYHKSSDHALLISEFIFN